jgi:uncharacterized lipoprotein YddW (UPF0748 family)
MVNFKASFAIWFVSAALVSAATAAPPVRGVWLSNVGSDAMASRAGLVQVVARCKAVGVNTIYPVVWNRGYTLYPSPLMEREFGVAMDPRLRGFDPLKELIELAHAEGIRVVAWFEFGFAASYQQPDGGRILRNRPEWRALDRKGKLVSRNGFQWMNAFDPAVQDFMLAMLKEVVSKYDVDGVQGDDRLPACPNTAGYDAKTIATYRAEHNGAAPPSNYADPEWTQWRSDKLSDFVERTYRELKAMEPDLCVSWAPSVWPWSRNQYLQDWPRWAREGWGDEFCPQVYRRRLDEYRATLEAVREQVPAEALPKVYPGVLVALAAGYDVPSTRLRGMIDTNRELGFEGEVFFYYEGLRRNAAVFDTLYDE